MMSLRFLALGRREVLEVLKILGFEIKEASSLEEVEKILEKEDLSSYELVLITEDILDVPPERVTRLMISLPLPVVILPSPGERKEMGKGIIARLIKETLGREIWQAD